MPVLRPVGPIPSHEFDYVRLALFFGPEGTAHVAHGGTMGGGYEEVLVGLERAGVRWHLAVDF